MEEPRKTPQQEKAASVTLQESSTLPPPQPSNEHYGGNGSNEPDTRYKFFTSCELNTLAENLKNLQYAIKLT